MNGKLITGFNNCPSVSPYRVPRCCSAGLGEEGSRVMQTESSGQETKATLQGWKGQGPTRGPFLPKVPHGSFLTGLDQVRPAGPRCDLIGWGFSLAAEVHRRPRQLRGLGTCLTALRDVTRSSGPLPGPTCPGSCSEQLNGVAPP